MSPITRSLVKVTKKVRLSSRLTYLWKLFPYVISPYLAAWAIYGWIEYALSSSTRFSFPQLFFFTIFSCAIIIVSVRICMPLKIIYLCGDSLCVWDISKWTRISMHEVMTVDGPDATTLRRISIKLRTSGHFGRDITFSAPFFSAQDIAANLRKLLDD